MYDSTSLASIRNWVLYLFFLALLLVGLSRAPVAEAELLGVEPLSFPLITNIGIPGSMTFDPVTGRLSVRAKPQLLFTPGEPPTAITGPDESFVIEILLDSTGTVAGHNPMGPPDLQVVGRIPNSPYSGVLLEGDVGAMGFVDQPGTTDKFDFLFTVTGGALVQGDGPFAPQFAGKQMAVLLDLEHSTFNGSFTSGFAGKPKPDVGGTCKGRIGDFVWNDANHNGIQDAGEQGIDGVRVLLNDGERVLVTTNGGANAEPGYYLFDGLCAGNYRVSIDPDTVPPGMVPSEVQAPNSTSDDDSDDPAGTDVTLVDDDSEDLSIDFGYQTPCRGAIGDYVWNDANRNGIQDPEEQGINGVMVRMASPPRTVATFTGGPNNLPGFYLFEGLCQGDYRVFVDPATVPVGMSTTRIGAAGSTPENDSNDPTGTTVNLVGDDSENLTIDFGYQTPCSGVIGDYVWNDADRDGVQDQNEQGINGVELLLRDRKGNLQTVTSFTDGPIQSPGFYLFQGLCADHYQVSVNPDTVPAGMLPTLIRVPGSTPLNDSDEPSGTPVVLVGDHSEDLSIDFGYQTPCSGAIGDYVWNDINRNGIQDGDEQGIDGVELVLRDSEGGLQMTTSFTGGGPTKRPGFYLFEGLCADDYQVSVNPDTVPKGMDVTSIRVDGSTPSNDSDDPLGTKVNLIQDDREDRTIDFGYQTPCSGAIGDYIWNDANHDGIQDRDEQGIDGVGVQLTDPAGRIQTVESFTGGPMGTVGYYRFTGLCAGLHTVAVSQSTVPAGMGSTRIQAPGSKPETDSDNPSGTPVMLDEDTSVDQTIDFGFFTLPVQCAECDGGVTQLRLRFTGEQAAVIEVRGKKNTLFLGRVEPNDAFSFYGQGKDGKMDNEIVLFVDGVEQGRLHTSCSKPIGPGLVVGPFEVVKGYSVKGGLICPITPPQTGGCSECSGGVTKLTLRYTGDASAAVKVEGKGGTTLFSGNVGPSGSFTVSGSGKEGKLDTEIVLLVNGTEVGRIHTSCSKPIGPGLVVGPFEVVEGYSVKGGLICPITPPQTGGCSECSGGVTKLILRYQGSQAAEIEVQGKDDKTLFRGTRSSGGSFTVTGSGKDGKLDKEIVLLVNGTEVGRIHTSCSKPIGPGLVVGPFEVVEGYSVKGGLICPIGDSSGKGSKGHKGSKGPKGSKGH